MSATLSSHILDTHLGKPAAGIAVTLHRVHDSGATTLLAHGTTNADGRVTPDSWQFDTAIDSTECQLNIGRYTVTFDTLSYFDTQQLTAFYPQVVIDFMVNDASHYHVPLLLSAHGYSTYRGS
ncbi:MAG: hydroxyisourate hydrolase [Psychrobacter sp.]|jgi:5-hydroxyisourate hydrolase|uniref:5-hydroxyisourate hydrolase n=1 Tax=Psychrobacter namhaensis TaxID=292734 RepID=A0ABW8L659_9GAMM|nr:MULTISPECIES: hydroxyisourate hydrolase [unclassified Psychrobacter]MCD1278950.1 hydroxyisourate hydrolase [Psychrobacter sp. CCUG 69069]MCD6251235.1 hydroxyisourate hydrolase [Psychrobacter sp.]